jgi:sensor histidine kinase YesM
MNMLEKNRKKITTIVLHACVWIAYASFIYTINLLTKPTTSVLQALFFILPFCLTFYLSVFCLGLYKKKGFVWGVLCFFIVFAAVATIGYIYMYLILPLAGVKLFSTKNFNIFLQNAVLGYVQHFAYAALYFYAKETTQKERQLRILQEEKLIIEQQKIQKELENALLKQQELNAQKDKLQFEYAFLRAQINPHFLHNTLNVLFSKALNYSPELADNILKLSRIMRYSIESLEYDGGKVSIQKELDHLQTLFDIHNMRFGDSKTICYNIEGEAGGQMLPPLSLITVVENAFKYGDLKDPEHPMQIKVVLKPKEIYFYCLNKKKKNNIPLSSMNIGITNLSKRLDASFKDKYNMKATDEQDFYTFELSIKN